MRYRQLFPGGPEVSVIGFGCWPMGGWLWSGVDDDESVQAVHKALDLGITLYDNADCYGFGHAEELLAKALGEKKKDMFIATKFGVEKTPEGKIRHNNARDYLLRACEASLTRLGVDCIDLYQVHWPDKETPIEETMDGLKQLQQEGKIRYIGVSNYDADRIRAALNHVQLHTHQPPYNLLQRDIEDEILPLCNENNMGLLAYGSICQGLLTGKYTKENMDFPEGDHRRSGHPQFREPEVSKNLRIIERLKPIAADAGRTLTELAVAWVLAQGDHIVALCGAKRPAQIEGSAAAADWVLTDEDVRQINAIVDEEKARDE